MAHMQVRHAPSYVELLVSSSTCEFTVLPRHCNACAYVFVCTCIRVYVYLKCKYLLFCGGITLSILFSFYGKYCLNNMNMIYAACGMLSYVTDIT